ncbi:MAG: sugar nucleotide-binding protein [Chloroflexi bacterium]|nr:sugar nucleotide-binding protein [Chloroflexota bacterium]
MRLLITGGSGFVGRHVLARLPPTCQWTATYYRRPPAEPGPRWWPLDLRDAAAVRAVVRAARPDTILHLAYDKADPAVTAAGTQHLVEAATAVGARVLLLSTDQVFDGRRGGYREEDPPAPVNAYGAAKLAAEEAVVAASGLVVRTSLVYRLAPPDPGNHALLLAPLAQGRTPRLFVDERRSPIYVEDLAAALLELLIPPLREAWERLGVARRLHVAGPEALDRYTFACQLAPCFGIPITRLQAARLATSGLDRPADCSLDSRRARALLRTPLRAVATVLAAAAPSTATPAPSSDAGV